MNFWHMQLHEDNINWKREEEVLEKVGYIGMGVWTETNPSNPQQTNFKENMKVGDIVAIRRGSKWIALTRVTGDHELLSDEQTTDLAWFMRRRKVEILDWYQPDIYPVEPCGNYQPTLSICASSTADTTINIKKWYEKVMNDNQTNEVAELLRYKHQVILQGPPGTGKTRLAKLVAESLTQPENKGSSEHIIDNLIQSFDTDSAEAKFERDKYQQLLSSFYKAFPKEELKDLTLENYCIGTGENNSFCWWIERGLQSLGYYFPGSSLSYKIYRSKAKNIYSKHGFVKNIEDDELAMTMVAETLHELVNNHNTTQAFARFGNSFVLKVLQSYYPEEYFPINSENAINNALKLFSEYDSKMNLIEKNQKLYSIYRDKKETFAKDITVNEFASLIWSNFNLKDGESLSEADEVITRGEYRVVQFHPAYTYEDFVRGVVAKTNEDGNIHYKVENKILAQFAKLAYENPNSNYVLIIDEINRANLPSVLGELIYSLEYRGKSVQSVYELSDNDSEDMQSENTGRSITLPKNLYIIGTMNTADRSVGHIDYAIRRRFAFYNVLPNVNVVKNEEARRLYNEVMKLFDNPYLSSDFDANDVRIGHSYFLASNEDMSDEDFILELRKKLKYEIKPILYEYIKDGILLDSAKDFVDNLNV